MNPDEVGHYVLGDLLVDTLTGEAPPIDRYMVITGHAEGALPNGTRVRKIGSKEGDTFPDDTEGMIVSSIGPLAADDAAEFPEMIGTFGYFIIWDPVPDVPVLTGGTKIEAVGETA